MALFFLGSLKEEGHCIFRLEVEMGKRKSLLTTSQRCATQFGLPRMLGEFDWLGKLTEKHFS